MQVYASAVNVRVYHARLNNYVQSPRSDVGKFLIKRGREIQAKAKLQVGKDTGALSRSIYVKHYRGAVNPYVMVGSKLRHAYMHHEGTSPHLIRPKNARALRFMYNGTVIYVSKVNHPGTKANRYLSDHLRFAVR